MRSVVFTCFSASLAVVEADSSCAPLGGKCQGHFEDGDDLYDNCCVPWIDDHSIAHYGLECVPDYSLVDGLQLKGALFNGTCEDYHPPCSNEGGDCSYLGCCFPPDDYHPHLTCEENTCVRVVTPKTTTAPTGCGETGVTCSKYSWLGKTSCCNNPTYPELGDLVCIPNSWESDKGQCIEFHEDFYEDGKIKEFACNTQGFDDSCPLMGVGQWKIKGRCEHDEDFGGSKCKYAQPVYPTPLDGQGTEWTRRCGEQDDCLSSETCMPAEWHSNGTWCHGPLKFACTCKFGRKTEDQWVRKMCDPENLPFGGDCFFPAAKGDETHLLV